MTGFRLVPTAFLLLLSAPCAVAETLIDGEYAVAGQNFDGSRYQGLVRIATGPHATCHIAWQIRDSGGAAGFCMRDGDSLAATYPANGNIGLVIYRIRPDGTMVGRWSLVDGPGVGTEVLVPKGRTSG
jgi:hypothetical protein